MIDIQDVDANKSRNSLNNSINDSEHNGDQSILGLSTFMMMEQQKQQKQENRLNMKGSGAINEDADSRSPFIGSHNLDIS